MIEFPPELLAKHDQPEPRYTVRRRDGRPAFSRTV